MGQNLIRGAATVLVTVIGTMLVRWSWRRFRPMSAMICLACALLAPRSTEAAIIEHDVTNYILPPGRALENDLIVAAETVRIEGTLDGDLIAAAQTITVTGQNGQVDAWLDFDGDGLADVTISDPGAAELILYKQTAGLGLTEPVRFPAFADRKAVRTNRNFGLPGWARTNGHPTL